MTAGAAGLLIPGVPLALGLLGLLLPADRRGPAATLGVAGAGTSLLVTLLLLLTAHQPVELTEPWVNLGGIEVIEKVKK